MSVNTKLTNLANEIREISGTTTKKSLDVMASDISAANDLIDEQETLLKDLRDIVDTLPEPISGVEYHPDDNGNDGLSIDRSFSYIDIKQENEIYTYADCYIMPSGNLWFNEADGTTDLYINTIFNNIVLSTDNRVEIRDINCDLNFDGINYVIINAEDGIRTDFEINSSFNNIEFNADNRIMVYDSELMIASSGDATLRLDDFSGQVNAPILIPENIKSGVNIFGVTGTYEGSGGGGSDGGLETCTVTYDPFSPAFPDSCQIKYIDSTGKLNTTNYNPMQSIEVVCQKNTLIFFEGIPTVPKITAEDASPWSKFFGGNLVIAVTSNTTIET